MERIEKPSANDVTYHLFGVPLRTGSFYPGSENDAQAYREAQILQRLKAAGCQVAKPDFLHPGGVFIFSILVYNG